MPKITLNQLNALDRPDFVRHIGGVFEHSPWIADRTWPARPFGSVAGLHQALCQTMWQASTDEQLALIRAHPDLVGRAVLTAESKREQAAAGLGRLSPDEIDEFRRYNARYWEKFDFPFVICARENDKFMIKTDFLLRLMNTRDQEIQTALTEIGKIARLRLADLISET